MSEWKTQKLADLADIYMGYPFKSDEFTGPPGVRLARGMNVKRGAFEWSDGETKYWSTITPDLKPYELRKGDILIGMDGSRVGDNWVCVSEYDLPCLLVQRVARLRVKQGFCQGFLKYLIGNPAFAAYVKAIHTGTSIPHISGNQIGNYPIPVPPLPTQRRIAHILGTLDDKIELNRRMNRTLEKMAAALFKSWFIDFDPVHANADGRDTNLPAEITDLFPDTFEDSDLGPIPAGWTVAPMKDLAGVNVRGIKKDYPHARIRYVDISSVSQGSLDQTTTYDLTDAPSRAKRLVQTGETIWSCVRPNRKAYLYIDQPADNLVVSTGFAVLSPRTVPASYLHQWVTTQSFVDYLTAYATGAAYPAVKADTFETAKMLLPGKGILKAFHDLVGPLRNRIAHNHRQNRRLSGLRDTLLPKLLSGEIEAPAAEATAEEGT